MKFFYSHKSITISQSDNGMSLSIDNKLLPEFKTLVQRGINLWPDATPELKELADLITNGNIMQNYYRQDTSPKKGNENGS